MASKNTKRMSLRDAAGLGTMVLAVTGMIVPTMASAQDRSGRGEPRAEQRMNRERSERMTGAQPRQAAPSAPAAAAPQYPSRQGREVRPMAPAAQGQATQRQGWRGQANGSQGNWQQQRAPDGTAVRDGRGARQWRGARDARPGNADGPQQQRGYAGNVARDGRAAEQWRNQGGARSSWQEGRRYSDNRNNDRGNSWQANRGQNRNWDRTWRNNSRYDWSSYRNRNRGIYSSGRYSAPYRSYSYSRLGIGYTLGSLFYGQNYWISDPWSYRLPDVYGAYRWVRYYDDVLLVDTYSGEVVDVIYDFFM